MIIASSGYWFKDKNLGDGHKKKNPSIEDIKAGIAIHNKINLQSPDIKLFKDQYATNTADNYFNINKFC